MSMVLITGGNGFIGGRLCYKLSLSGRKVKKIVKKIIENDKSEQHICELGIEKIPEDVFDNVETVFHLAGATQDIDKTSLKKNLYYDLNVAGTEQLALAAAKKGVKFFVYISSVKAGGIPIVSKCMTEDDQAEPDGIYGKTKREAELRLLEIGKNTKMNISIIRPSLVYGPGVKGNLREMITGVQKGWFPPLPEVKNRRSMIHVDDLVDIMLLVENNHRSKGEIFIATDGNEYSSNQIYRAICMSLNKDIKKWVVPNIIFILIAKIGNFANTIFPFPFDSYRYQKLLGDECYSSEKIQTMLGYKAKNNIFINFTSTNDG
jgi:UDP-glucose 4-epimerase